MAACAIGQVELRLPCQGEAMQTVQINFMMSLKAELQETLVMHLSRFVVCVGGKDDAEVELEADRLEDTARFGQS